MRQSAATEEDSHAKLDQASALGTEHDILELSR